MATNAGTLEVVITATTAGLQAALKNARTAVNEGASDWPKFGSVIETAMKVGVASVVGLGVASVHAFGQAQKSATGLANALANRGIFSPELLEDLLKYSTELQHLTGISDEVISDAQATLVTFGLQGQVLRETTRAALDLAAAKDISLATAAQLLGKAFAGETSTLKRYGIVINEAIPDSLRFAEALRLIGSQFGGRAESQGKNFFGMLNIAKEDVSDFAEEIGRNLVPAVQRFVQFMIDNRTVLLAAAGEIGTAIRGWIDDFADVMRWIHANKGTLTKIGQNLWDAFKLGPSGLGGLLLYARGQRALEDPNSKENLSFVSAPTVPRAGPASLVPAGIGLGGGGAGGQEQAALSFEILWRDAFDKTFNAGKMMADNIALVMNTMVSGLSSAMNGFFNDMLIAGKSLGESLQNVGLSLLNSVFGVISQMLAKFIVAKALELTVHKTTEALKTTATIAGETASTTAAVVGAKVKIAANLAVAKTSVMAAHAGIPFIGIGIGLAAAAVIAAIMSQMGVFAEGGIVNGPMLGLVGEAGPEAIIPLKKGKEMGIFGDGAGGGTGAAGGAGVGGDGRITEVHLHFDGATLVDGDETKWDNIARRYIIPALAAYQDKTRSSDLRRWPTRVG